MNTMIYNMMDLMVRDLCRKAEGSFCVIPWTWGMKK